MLRANSEITTNFTSAKSTGESELVIVCVGEDDISPTLEHYCSHNISQLTCTVDSTKLTNFVNDDFTKLKRFPSIWRHFLDESCVDEVTRVAQSFALGP